MKKARLGVRSLWASLVTVLCAGYCPPMPSVETAEWQHVREDERECPDPQGACEWDIKFTNFVVPSSAAIAGYVFQKVDRNWAWVECGPNPDSDSGLDTYYERFKVTIDPDDGSLSIQGDVFGSGKVGDDTEYVDTVTGDAIFVPLNALTSLWLPELGDLKNDKGTVIDNNGDVVGMTLPGGGFVGFTSGGAPNQVDPPSVTDAGITYDWANNFGGVGFSVGWHQLEWNHVCCINEKWHVLECLPGSPN